MIVQSNHITLNIYNNNKIIEKEEEEEEKEEEEGGGVTSPQRFASAGGQKYFIAQKLQCLFPYYPTGGFFYKTNK